MRFLLALILLLLPLPAPAQTAEVAEAWACREQLKSLNERLDEEFEKTRKLPKDLETLGGTIKCPTSGETYRFKKSKRSCRIHCRGTSHRKAGLKANHPSAVYRRFGLQTLPYYVGKPSHYAKLLAERREAKEQARNYVKRLRSVTARVKKLKKEYEKNTGQQARNLASKSRGLTLPKKLRPPLLKLSRPNERKLSEEQIRELKSWERDLASLKGFMGTVEGRYRELYWLKSEL